MRAKYKGRSVSYSFDTDSSRVRRNKFGEVWSSNLGDLDVKLYPPKAHFSEDHISAPMLLVSPSSPIFCARHEIDRS